MDKIARMEDASVVERVFGVHDIVMLIASFFVDSETKESHQYIIHLRRLTRNTFSTARIAYSMFGSVNSSLRHILRPELVPKRCEIGSLITPIFNHAGGFSAVCNSELVPTKQYRASRHDRLVACATSSVQFTSFCLASNILYGKNDDPDKHRRLADLCMLCGKAGNFDVLRWAYNSGFRLQPTILRTSCIAGNGEFFRRMLECDIFTQMQQCYLMDLSTKPPAVGVGGSFTGYLLCHNGMQGMSIPDRQPLRLCLLGGADILQYAAQRGCVDVIEAVRVGLRMHSIFEGERAGAQPFARKPFGEQAVKFHSANMLCLAASRGHLSTIEYLRDFRFSPNNLHDQSQILGEEWGEDDESLGYSFATISHALLSVSYNGSLECASALHDMIVALDYRCSFKQSQCDVAREFLATRWVQKSKVILIAIRCGNFELARFYISLARTYMEQNMHPKVESANVKCSGNEYVSKLGSALHMEFITMQEEYLFAAIIGCNLEVVVLVLNIFLERSETAERKISYDGIFSVVQRMQDAISRMSIFAEGPSTLDTWSKQIRNKRGDNASDELVQIHNLIVEWTGGEGAFTESVAGRELGRQMVAKVETVCDSKLKNMKPQVGKGQRRRVRSQGLGRNARCHRTNTSPMPLELYTHPNALRWVGQDGPL
jgi:hypothetical protein